jgi:hypothetical protein
VRWTIVRTFVDLFDSNNWCNLIEKLL